MALAAEKLPASKCCRTSLRALGVDGNVREGLGEADDLLFQLFEFLANLVALSAEFQEIGLEIFIVRVFLGFV